MIRSCRVITMIALCTVLYGCATSDSAFVRVPTSPAADIGYLVFSLTGTGPASPAIDICPELHLRAISNGVAEKIETCLTKKLLPGSPAVPFPVRAGMTVSFSDPMGKIVVIGLPAGDYEFYKYYVMLPFHYTSYNSPLEFDYKFSVVPGAINYLGDLNFAIGLPIGMQLTVVDRRSRDVRLLDAQLPAYGQKEKLWCSGCVLRN
jgi:hypothetical protein